MGDQSGMTPKRLAEIEARVAAGDSPDPWADAGDLLAEALRLRGIIQTQVESARREWLDEGDVAALHRAEHWRDLLYPTEGKNDE